VKGSARSIRCSLAPDFLPDLADTRANFEEGRYCHLSLPVRANLEHLKNEAKQLLKELRRENAEATLSEAQLAVARRYSFTSWRTLKAHVDAMQNEGARLIQAVRNGDLETARTVLDKVPELVNAVADLDPYLVRPSDTRAMRLIHLTVAENHMDMARLLIERGVNLNVRNADGRLPVHDCFELSRDEFAKLLFASGAEADVCAAAAYGMLDRLREILAADLSQANDLQTGVLPVGWATYGNQLSAAQLLLEQGSIVNRAPYDAEAWGPAAHIASVSFGKLLLEHGADPNCRSIGKAGDTPLHAVIKSRIVSDPCAFVELLLAHGADPALRNNEGLTPLDVALSQLDTVAETYFPARPVAVKKLDRVITLLGGKIQS
jgi:ankyrin repeat protein